MTTEEYEYIGVHSLWSEWLNGCLMSVGAIAYELKTTPDEVKKLMDDGHLIAVQLNDALYTTKDGLDQYKRERSKETMTDEKQSTNNVPWESTKYHNVEETKTLTAGSPTRSLSQIARDLAQVLMKVPPGASMCFNFPKSDAAYRVQNQVRDGAILAGWYKDIAENEIGDWLMFRSSVNRVPDGSYNLHVFHLTTPKQSGSVTARKKKIRELQAAGLPS